MAMTTTNRTPTGNPRGRAGRRARAAEAERVRLTTGALLESLGSTDPVDRICAAADLGSDDIPGALTALIARLAIETDRDVRASIFNALARLRDPGVCACAAALLASDDAYVRNGAVALLQAKGPEALPAIRDALASTDADVRRFAIDALGSISAPEVVPVYEAALRDENVHVRMSAVEHLGDRRVARMRPQLEAAFAAERVPTMVSALYAALLAVGDARTWRVILARHPTVGAAPAHLRGSWLRALGPWAGPGAIETLADAAREVPPGDLLDALRDLLTRHAPRRSPAGLVSYLRSLAREGREPGVRRRAAECLDALRAPALSLAT
jgi:hypothetical protein